MKRWSVPILGWVVGGLLAVGALPFVVTWLQIDRSRDALVLQTQQTHRVLARSVADEIDRHLSVLGALIEASANDPAVWEQPNSEAAGAALGRLFDMHPDFLAVGSFATADGGPVAVIQLRRGGVEFLPADVVAGPEQLRPRRVTAGGRGLVQIQRETPRPGLYLSVLAAEPRLDRTLRIPGISDARIALFDDTGELLAGDPGLFEALVAEQRQAAFMPNLPDGSFSDFHAEVPTVGAYAGMPETGWRVVTLQPAEEAEQASGEMWSAARMGLGATLTVVVLLSLGAWWAVVRPIRRLVRAQQRLVGDAVGGGGGEIRQLEASFGRLEEAIRERDKLSEVFLDRYQILSQIGAGAMGMVYLGRDPKLDRKVALKTILLSDELSGEERETLAARLIREGLTAAKLTHPNIVTVYDVLGDDAHAFIAMEYIEGESLEDELEREGSLSPRRMAEVAEGVLRALVAAHKEDVIHRDIKPANVLVTADGAIKLGDFGIASFRRQVARGDEGLVLGTPGYLAPECYAEKAYDARTDLFALGVTLVECLTGATPFGGRNLQHIITRTSSRDVILPANVTRRMPEAMVEWIDRLLAKDPNRRIATASEALNDLREFQIELATRPASADAAPAAETQAHEAQTTTAALDVDGTRRIDVDPADTGTRRIDP